MDSCKVGLVVLDGIEQQGTRTSSTEALPTCAAAENSALKSRRRSLSVATAQPSVETVIVKAKRAAQSLWMLLHAQNCCVANKCPHAGCHEAKLVHLHMKTCPAGSDFKCPTNYHGCEQARKLLAHYRRCKALRARQAGQAPGRRDPEQQHSCLVCSLVARQARTTLERTATPKAASATTVSRKLAAAKHTVSKNVRIVAPSGAATMLPPPPRRKQSLVPETPTSSPKSHNMYSPPSDASLGHPVPSTFAAMMGPPLPRMRDSDYGTLGKSIDTAKGTMLSHRLSRGRERSQTVVEAPSSIESFARPRSASWGERRSASPEGEVRASASCDTIFEEGSHGSRDSVELDFELELNG